MPLAGIIYPTPPPHSPPIQWSQNILRPDAFQRHLCNLSPPEWNHGLLVVSCCPYLLQGLGKDTHRVAPTPGCGAGRLPSAANADRKEYSGTSLRSRGHLPPRPPWWLPGSRLHYPVSLQKTVSSLPRYPFRGGPVPRPKFYPLGRDSEKSSNSLQELAEEQRLRKLSTRGGKRE